LRQVQKVILIAVFLAVPAALRAAGPGTASAQFLKIGVGARAEAMGEAYGAVSDDPYALYWNPAGLGRVKNRQLNLSYTVWLEEISNSYLAYAHPLPKYGATLGVSINSVSVPQITKYDNTGTAAGGTYTASDTAFSAGFSKIVAKQLWAGLGLKSVSSKIDDATASAFAADAGLLYARGKYSFCAVAQNIGTKMKFVNGDDPLPLNYKIGTAYSIPGKGLLLSMDVNIPSDNTARVNAGVEYDTKFSDELELAARAGARTNVQGLDPISAFSAGFGLKWRWIDFDIAWAPYGDLGDVFRTSAGFRFGEGAAAPARASTVKPVKPAAAPPAPAVKPELPPEPPAAPAIPAISAELDIPVVSTAPAAPAASPTTEANNQLKRDYLFKGQGFYFSGKYEDSFFCFKKALEIDPNNTEAKEYIGRIRKFLAEKKAADKEAGDKQDKYKHELFVKGQEYYASGEYKKALTYFDNVLAIDPLYADAYKYINKIHKILNK
jgi:tetratricopeptide (TPR) repeat protein